MRLHARSISKVGLSDILRRRRASLKSFLEEMGIVTYELLLDRCKSMGVVAPSQEDFLAATGTSPNSVPDTSSPTEGVVVLADNVDMPQISEHLQLEESETFEMVSNETHELLEKQQVVETPTVPEAASSKKRRRLVAQEPTA